MERVKGWVCELTPKKQISTLEIVRGLELHPKKRSILEKVEGWELAPKKELTFPSRNSEGLSVGSKTPSLMFENSLGGEFNSEKSQKWELTFQKTKSQHWKGRRVEIWTQKSNSQLWKNEEFMVALKTQVSNLKNKLRIQSVSTNTISNQKINYEFWVCLQIQPLIL